MLVALLLDGAQDRFGEAQISEDDLGLGRRFRCAGGRCFGGLVVRCHESDGGEFRGDGGGIVGLFGFSPGIFGALFFGLSAFG